MSLLLTMNSKNPEADASHVVNLTTMTEEERVLETRLRRKIDIMILPLVVVAYILNYIDRNNFAAARLQGLEQSLDLRADEYQNCLLVLFVGYLLGQVPSNLLLNRLGRPSLFIGAFIIAWGLVSALTSLVQNYSQMMVCRFLLGAVEAPFFPDVLFYLSKWYRRKELNLRVSIFFSGTLLGGGFGNLIAAAVLRDLKGACGLDAWRWLYIIEGTVTVSVGIVFCIFLPDFPRTWKHLKPQMQHIALKPLTLEARE
ncbi:hypothetical protein AFLA70_521g000721 [Aspergillus flavus AF70]|nr:hypothetical protein AFLA70_521g000721 [Aspergillus flavus AF70]